MNRRYASLVAVLFLATGCGGGSSDARVDEPAAPQADSGDQPATPQADSGDQPATPLDPIFENPSIGDLLPQPMDVIWQSWFGDFPGMVERRIVRVGVPYGGYQFYYDRGVPRGAVYELVQRFEKKINEDLGRRNVRIYVAAIPLSRDQLIPSLLEGHVDVVAGDLTMTDVRSLMVDFSRPLMKDVHEVIVTNASVDDIESLEDLAKREIYVRRSSSYFEHLQQFAVGMRERGLEEPVLRPANELLESEDILELIDAGIVEITAMDAYKAKFWAGVFPNIVIREDLVLNEGGRIAWTFRKDSPELAEVVNDFLRKFGRGTLVGNDTYNRYLADANRVRCSDSVRNTEEATALAKSFQTYGENYDFDWLMLVAQGMQESGLRHNRKSPAGAVGIMQVKPSTAADHNVGIDDISSADNNIHAAAKYLRFIANRYYSDDDIDELNQWMFSLAAYNAGPAKINRYRNEARKQGLDANRWFNNVEIVAARRIGRETVTYVSNVFKYYAGYKLVVERGKVRDARFADLLGACDSTE